MGRDCVAGRDMKLSHSLREMTPSRFRSRSSKRIGAPTRRPGELWPLLCFMSLAPGEGERRLRDQLADCSLLLFGMVLEDAAPLASGMLAPHCCRNPATHSEMCFELPVRCAG